MSGWSLARNNTAAARSQRNDHRTVLEREAIDCSVRMPESAVERMSGESYLTSKIFSMRTHFSPGWAWGSGF